MALYLIGIGLGDEKDITVEMDETGVAEGGVRISCSLPGGDLRRGSEEDRDHDRREHDLRGDASSVPSHGCRSSSFLLGRVRKIRALERDVPVCRSVIVSNSSHVSGLSSLRSISR